MKTKLPMVALLGFVLIAAAACSGSDGLSSEEEEALQQERDEALQQAEEDRKRAEEEERKRKAAEEAAAQAERERREAEAAEREAEEQRQAAEEAEQAAEEARQAAIEERNRLAAEAERRRRADATEAARVAIGGDWEVGNADPGVLAVATPIEYGEPVAVTTPIPPFTTTTGRSGRWATTLHTDRREAVRHTIEIYTDVEAPTRSPFRTSEYNPSDAVIDGTGKVIGHVDITTAAHSRVAASGAFPRDSGNPKPFTLVDRGLTATEYTATGLAADGSADDDALETAGITRAQYNQYRADRGFRDDAKFPDRYAYTTSGTLQGAGGTYRCDATTATTGGCTVQNRGGSFSFVGDWDFIPSSGTVQIVVPDAHYMWFGWWAEQTVEHTADEHTADIWAFEAAHGGTNAVTTLAEATGSATYRGPAAGRYAVYEPDTGDSGIGSFTASATLQADFGDGTTTGTVSGTITGFSNDSSWSLGLKRGTITGGTTGNDGTTVGDLGGVTWAIDGVPDDSGKWEAGFYSNLELETAGTITYQPHGIAGTFEAEYDPSGTGPRAALIGGFGAHR